MGVDTRTNRWTNNVKTVYHSTNTVCWWIKYHQFVVCWISTESGIGQLVYTDLQQKSFFYAFIIHIFVLCSDFTILTPCRASLSKGNNSDTSSLLSLTIIPITKITIFLSKQKRIKVEWTFIFLNLKEVFKNIVKIQNSVFYFILFLLSNYPHFYSADYAIMKCCFWDFPSICNPIRNG